jgi:23S rRNA (adenine2503-C2)-methyltransferase
MLAAFTGRSGEAVGPVGGVRVERRIAEAAPPGDPGARVRDAQDKRGGGEVLMDRIWHDESGRIDIKSLDRAGLERFMVDELGEKRFRALQVWKWLWQRSARSFDEMTDLAKPTRAKLEQAAFISFLDLDTCLESLDGTRKYLWRLHDGHRVESVLIPDEDRLTLCMSSQVGCAMACTFCLTGDLGLKRNLSPSEIANQPLQVGLDEVARRRAMGLPDPPGAYRPITNLVFMGMGEPLHNIDNLCTSLDAILHDHAQNYSHRKVTVSTVGLVPKIEEFAARTPVNLAISLNSSNNAQRDAIMPVNKRWDLEALIEACKRLPLPNGKRITFEYVMFRGFNDTLDDAARLFRLLKGVRAKINLIPYNENPHRDIRRPDDADVKAFQAYLFARGMNCTVRTTRGIDISAACGQLGKARLQVDGLEPMVATG